MKDFKGFQKILKHLRGLILLRTISKIWLNLKIFPSISTDFKGFPRFYGISNILRISQNINDFTGIRGIRFKLERDFTEFYGISGQFKSILNKIEMTTYFQEFPKFQRISLIFTYFKDFTKYQWLH